MVRVGMTGRRSWLAAVALGTAVPLVVLAYLLAMNALDRDTATAPMSLQLIWWVCVVAAIAAAVGAGLLGGLVRAVVVSALIWGVLATGVYFLLGPTCPLAAIGPLYPPKHGLPPIRLQESFDALCSVSGTVAGSVDARWVLKAGALATALTAIGGVAGLARRARLPVRPSPADR